jgi:hypothetical protein
VLLQVRADAVWRDEHREQVVIELDLRVGTETAEAHELWRSRPVWYVGEFAGAVMRYLVMDAAIASDIIRRSEYLLEVICESAGFAAGIATRAF